MSHPGLGSVARLRAVQTRSISPENFDGSAGGGGRATEGTGADMRARPRAGLEGLAERRHRSRARPSTSPTSTAPGRITHIWITTHTDNWRTLLLRAYWDGADEPAIEVPYGDFFCQRLGRFAQVNSQPIAANPHGGFNSYWPMPFRAGARLTMENLSDRRRPGLLPDHLRDRRRLRRPGLPARAVAAQQSAGAPDPAHAPRGRRGPGAVRRHLPRLGRQQQRLVGRGRDQVLPRRRRGVPDDLRHRAPRTTSAAPGTSTCPGRATPRSPRRTSGCRR